MSLLIDIEGIDGSGKGTQARLLCDRLVQSGVTATLISFPRYADTFFGRAIGEFLNGRFGTLEQVHPFLVSLLFAGVHVWQYRNNVAVIIVITALSIVLTVSRALSGKVLPAFIIHLAFNGIQSVIIVLGGFIDADALK